MAFSDLYIASWRVPVSGPFTFRVLTAAVTTPMTWTLLSSTYSPTYGTCPNPQVYQRSNTDWRLVHCNADERVNWTNIEGSILSFASSTDGLNFTPTFNIDYTGIFATIFGHTPIFVDRSGVARIVFPASVTASGRGPGGPFQMYEIHATNVGLTTWSPPTLLTRTDTIVSYQDPALVDDSGGATGAYYMTYGFGIGISWNNTTSATFPTAGWAVLHAGRDGEWTGSGGSGQDGPTILKVGSTWYLVSEDHSGMHYRTTPVNVTSDWRVATPTWAGPFNVTSTEVERTGSIFAITAFPNSGVSRSRMQTGM